MDMDPIAAAASESQVSRKTLANDREPMLFCPVCSLRLAERKCKLYCERCGYYMSCADYY
jgi:ribosomal protein S27AE